MSQYRLHIDIPMPFGEEDAIKKSNMIIELFCKTNLISSLGIDHLNYRLGHDDDRQKSNYMMKNENGHVNNKKSKISFETLQGADANNQMFRTTDCEGNMSPLDKLVELDREMGLI
jgi:hypothetical protein